MEARIYRDTGMDYIPASSELRSIKLQKHGKSTNIREISYHDNSPLRLGSYVVLIDEHQSATQII